ncbi:hypothetical protein BDP27DRAFT_1425240 [Rhodocollybia butyracea]|uniref:Poly [ADP-ribose] polymerase n=1 Tax=Rhodocollybia butyracea TaxID=206335 RepID=A0A9P5PFZ0_9AGAR|nr:hypothetical protein BDP27DRAFT_1425240 [Rhodocollybia butyracea]
MSLFENEVIDLTADDQIDMDSESKVEFVGPSRATIATITSNKSKTSAPASIAGNSSKPAIFEDERLARKLQTEEREGHRKMIAGVVERKEGIVFRNVINADGTLEDGSPAHPDDLARFEPWKKLFESTSGGNKIKRCEFYVKPLGIVFKSNSLFFSPLDRQRVNYELEKQFEEAKLSLRGVDAGDDDPAQELLLFHGTLPKNIDSILETGFRIGGVGGHAVVNGTGEGYGVYLAKDALLSFGRQAPIESLLVEMIEYEYNNPYGGLGLGGYAGMGLGAFGGAVGGAYGGAYGGALGGAFGAMPMPAIPGFPMGGLPAVPPAVPMPGTGTGKATRAGRKLGGPSARKLKGSGDVTAPGNEPKGKGKAKPKASVKKEVLGTSSRMTRSVNRGRKSDV